MKAIRSAGQLAVVLHVLVALVLIPVSAIAVQQSEQQTIRPDSIQSDDFINRLIADLGHPSFSVRQRAMQQLWALGDDAKQALRSFTNDEDAEVANRAKRILEHLEFGIHPDMPPEIARAIYAFHKGDVNQQFAILDRLVEMGRYHLTLDLVDCVDDLQQRYYLMTQVYPAGETLSRRFLDSDVRCERLDELDKLMNHSLMWEFHPGDCALYFALRDRSRDHIAELEIACRQPEVTDALRKRLILHYRVNRQSDRAAEIALALNESASQHHAALQLEAGQWLKAVADPASDQPRSVQSMAENVLLAYWSGDPAQWEQAKLELYHHFPPEQHAEELANLHLLMLDTSWLVENIDRFDLSFGFEFLCHLHRFDEAFVLAKVPDDSADREKWFRARVAELKNTVQRIIRQIEVDDRNARNQFDFCLEFATVVGSLGNIEESLKYFDILIEGIKWKDDEFFQAWNESVFERLCQLDVGERIWDYFLTLEMDRSGRQVFAYLFPNSRAQAIFWQSVLQDEFPDPVDRIRFVATLVRSPFADQQSIDLEEYASVARDALEQMPIRMRKHQLLALADTMQIHGHHQLARDLQIESGHFGNVSAFESLAKLAADRGKWSQAAQWYRQAVEVGADPYELSFSYQLALSRGDLPEYDPIALQRSLLACLNSSEWLEFSDRANELGDEALAARLLEQFIRTGDVLEGEDGYYRRRLASLQARENIETSIRLYRQASHSYFRVLLGTELPNLAFHQLATETHFGQVRRLMAQGNYDGAMDLLRQFAVFVSGTSELAEEFVPVLDEVGQHKYADELFGLIADRYVKVLESYPDSATHHNNYAWVNARCNRDLNGALNHAETAVRLNPHHTSYLDTLAEVCFRLGDNHRALSLARQCVAINPYKEHYREQVVRFEAAIDSDKR